MPNGRIHSREQTNQFNRAKLLSVVVFAATDNPGEFIMSQGVEKQIFYFDKKGPDNTDKTLDLALACCQERGINKIVVASSRGQTALRLHSKASASVEIIAVTYASSPEEQSEIYRRIHELV